METKNKLIIQVLMWEYYKKNSTDSTGIKELMDANEKKNVNTMNEVNVECINP